MTDINKTTAERSVPITGSYGNGSKQTEDYTSIGALAVDDVFYAMKVSANSLITDLKLNAEAGLSVATGTIDIGYIMGATTDPDYFSGTTFNSNTGGQKISAAMPLECTDDCYIIVTPKTAITVVDKQLAVTVGYVYQGAP